MSDPCPIILTDADWTRLREAAALYPSVGWVVALIREALDASDYDELVDIADMAAKACYDLPGDCALYGVPGEDWREIDE